MKSVITVLAALIAAPLPLLAADNRYVIDLDQPPPQVLRDHLGLGGNAPGGHSISVTSQYIVQDGTPFVPIIGEFHYNRYPAAAWEEELRKMKAGGINTVASYVFWNVHERTEGNFDWSGDLNLRRFVELCGRVGLQVIIRVGPFGHGEMRNGGLPDWLYGRTFGVRSNDDGYLAYVARLYAQIGAQLTGLLYKEGGPVIGIQLENEFQHSAAPWEIRYAGSLIESTVADRDRDVIHAGVSVSEVENRNAAYGRDHMTTLKLIAKRDGLDTPLYTATGWGDAAIVPRGSLPVSAAYAYPYWSKRDLSPFYLFKDIRRNPDYSPVSFDTELYPSIPAELGPGMSVTYLRRPFVPEESIEPLIVRVLGSGSNGVGYYMYHGGATPAFNGRFYNEDASGLPKINYDFQAPLSQYGQMRSHFQSLRVLHLFLQSYAAKLAPLPTLLPGTNAEITANNMRTLRYAARAAEGAGFLFLINYQDHITAPDLTGLQLEVKARRKTIALPHSGTFNLRSGACAILPINLDLDGNLLRSATVQPLTILRPGGRPHYVFFSIPGLTPELVFDSGTVTEAVGCAVANEAGAVVVRGPAETSFSFSIDGNPVLVVPRQLALQAARFDDEHLVFSPAMLFAETDSLTLVSTGQPECTINVYPALAHLPMVLGAVITAVQPASPLMSAFVVRFSPLHYDFDWSQASSRRFTLRINPAILADKDAILRIDYVGDNGMAFIDGEMIDDHLFFGRPWEIGLKRFLSRLHNGKEIVFVFHAMQRDATYFEDIPEALRPSFAPNEKEYLKIRNVEFTPEYRAQIAWSTVR